MGRVAPPRPLSADDNRTEFDCGRASLNQWFQRHAWRNQIAGVSRTSVLCTDSGNTIVAFVSLSSGQIEREYLPKSEQRNRPDPIPVILLGQLAVDQRFQGQGHARSLLIFALATAIRISKDIGCFGVLTHPLDDELRDFYRRFGFEDLPFDHKRGMLAQIAKLEISGIPF